MIIYLIIVYSTPQKNYKLVTLFCFLKTLFCNLLALFLCPQLQQYLPLNFLLVQRLYFGLKHCGLFCIVLLMIHHHIFQWFVMFHFVPSSFFLISINSANYWRRKNLFNTNASMNSKIL